MEKFNPDEYLKQKESEDEFNPDWYLSKGVDDDSLSQDAVKVAAESLPMVGSVVGGAIAGGPTLGAATLGGSALGAMAGKAAQTLIEENFLNRKPKTIEEKLLELPKEAAYDVAGNVIGGKILGPVVDYGLNSLGKVYNKVAGGISKIPEPVMETMQKRYGDVDEISDVAFAADTLRENIQKDIKSFKTAQNVGISSAVRSKGQNKVNIKSVRDTLSSVKSRLDPSVNPEKIARIQKEIDIIDKIIDRPERDAEAVSKYLKDLELYELEMAIASKENVPVQMVMPELPVRPEGVFNPVGGDDLLPLHHQLFLEDRKKNLQMKRLVEHEDQVLMNTAPEPPTPPSFTYGEVTADQAYQLSQRLQNLADYTADGQALKRKDLIDIVFSRAAAKARNEVQKIIPEIAEYNKKLAQLHAKGKNINKNMLTADKPYSSIIGVGTGENKLAIKQIQGFQNVLGKDYVPEMQNIAAAQYFGNAGILPSEKTGSSLAPLLMSGGLGMQDIASGQIGQGLGKMALGLPLTPIGIKTTLGVKSAAKQVLNKAGITPANVSSEFIQYQAGQLDPIQKAIDIFNIMQNTDPYEFEQQLIKEKNLKPSEKALLRKENSSR